jgi:hypothetical protein
MRTIHRHAFIPVLNIETQEYSWERLKVVKVWAVPTSDNSFEINYILENCMRFPESQLITEEKKNTINVRLEHNKLVYRSMMVSGFRSQTIFSPANEMAVHGEELYALIKQSDEMIYGLIQNDEILGEESVLYCINNN